MVDFFKEIFFNDMKSNSKFGKYKSIIVKIPNHSKNMQLGNPLHENS